MMIKKPVIRIYYSLGFDIYNDPGTVQFFYGDLICFPRPFHCVNWGIDVGSDVFRHSNVIVFQPDWKKERKNKICFPQLYEIYYQVEFVGSPVVVRLPKLSGLPTVVFAYLLNSSHGDCGLSFMANPCSSIVISLVSLMCIRTYMYL